MKRKTTKGLLSRIIKEEVRKQLNEVGDRVITDNIVDIQISEKRSVIKLDINGKMYEVDFRVDKLGEHEDGGKIDKLLMRHGVDNLTELGVVDVHFRPMDDVPLSQQYGGVARKPPYDTEDDSYKPVDNPIEIASNVAGAVMVFLKKYNKLPIMGVKYMVRRLYPGKAGGGSTPDKRMVKFFNKYIEKGLKSKHGGNIMNIPVGTNEIVYLAARPINGVQLPRG